MPQVFLNTFRSIVLKIRFFRRFALLYKFFKQAQGGVVVKNPSVKEGFFVCLSGFGAVLHTYI